MNETLVKLIARWRADQAAYPSSPEGVHAAAAVRVCANELERWARSLDAPRQWLVRGGGGHEAGEDGIQAVMMSGESVVETLEAYSEYVLGLPDKGEEEQDAL